MFNDRKLDKLKYNLRGENNEEIFYFLDFCSRIISGHLTPLHQTIFMQILLHQIKNLLNRNGKYWINVSKCAKKFVRSLAVNKFSMRLMETHFAEEKVT